MTANKNILFSIIGFCIIGLGTASAGPIINSATEMVTHKGTIVIGGSGFGTKHPAAPIMWDDGEHSNTLTQKGWCDHTPTSTGNPWNTAYRNAQFRGMGNPHNQGARFISGGHKQTQPNYSAANGANVTITTSLGQVTDKLYMFWYYALDPSWPTDGQNNPPEYIGNNKFLNYETECDEYTAGRYDQHPHSHLPQLGVANPGWDRNVPSENPCPSNSYFCFKTPIGNWQHFENIVDFNDFQLAHVLTGDDTYANSVALDSSTMSNYSNIDHITIGGYWCYQTNGCACGSIGGESTHCGDDDAYRFFDDIYIDITYARVMLANNATYANATTIEPQIPSAWSKSSITATVNLGALKGPTAYLFVFDANNNHNSVGYSVAIGVGGSPDAPDYPESVEIISQ